MKRWAGLWPKIPLANNLERALWKASRGKRTRRDAAAFSEGMPDSLWEVGERLRAGQGPWNRFREFRIMDPKERAISAPSFPDRVMHHAVMNLCEPAFERWLIDQTYACRVGRGLRAAVRETERWMCCRRWYLQCDVRHYFESIPKVSLSQKLRRLFQDELLLNWWQQLLDGWQPFKTCGMPIGALTSQHLANFYLGFADRLVKERLRIRAYVRQRWWRLRARPLVEDYDANWLILVRVEKGILGSVSQRHAPGQPRRRLQQHGGELPVCEPQRQSASEPQQQPGLASLQLPEPGPEAAPALAFRGRPGKDMDTGPTPGIEQSLGRAPAIRSTQWAVRQSGQRRKEGRGRDGALFVSSPRTRNRSHLGEVFEMGVTRA